MSIQSEVIRLLSNEGCGVLPREEIDADRRLYDIGFASLRYMEFVVLLEESLQLSVPDELLDVQPETKVGDIIQAMSACHEQH